MCTVCINLCDIIFHYRKIKIKKFVRKDEEQELKELNVTRFQQFSSIRPANQNTSADLSEYF